MAPQRVLPVLDIQKYLIKCYCVGSMGTKTLSEAETCVRALDSSGLTFCSAVLFTSPKGPAARATLTFPSPTEGRWP